MDHYPISSHGTLPGIADTRYAVLALNKPYDILCSSLELRLEPDQCNDHITNTRDFDGPTYEIDHPRYEYLPLPGTGYIRLFNFDVYHVNDKKCVLSEI